jgi:hypothetical protein
MTMSATMHSHREDAGRVLVIAAAQRLDDTLVDDGAAGGDVADFFCGLAVKQVMPPAEAAKSTLRDIASGERYLILDSGEADVVVPSGLGFTPVKGTKLWINPTTQALANATGAGLLKLGRVRYMGPDPSRGLPTGMMTVSFDARKDF